MLARKPPSRPGRYCIRFSRVFTRAVSWVSCVSGQVGQGPPEVRPDRLDRVELVPPHPAQSPAAPDLHTPPDPVRQQIQSLQGVLHLNSRRTTRRCGQRPALPPSRAAGPPPAPTPAAAPRHPTSRPMSQADMSKGE